MTHIDIYISMNVSFYYKLLILLLNTFYQTKYVLLKSTENGKLGNKIISH